MLYLLTNTIIVMMKKIILFIMLLVQSLAFTQESFIRKYTKYRFLFENQAEKSKEANITVVFNQNNKEGITTYSASGKKVDSYEVSDITEHKTKEGYKYQLISVIIIESKWTFPGEKVFFQFFDDLDILRLVLSSELTVEYYN